MKTFISYLQSFCDIPEDQLQKLIDLFQPIDLKKGHYYAQERGD